MQLLAADPESPAVSRTVALQRRTEKMQIVVMDDSEVVRDLIVYTLCERGYRATASGSSVETLRFMRKHAPEPILLIVAASLAVSMGTAFDELLAQKPRPIVTLTCTEPGICPLHPNFACAGMSSCLKKPFMPEMLVRRVRQLLAVYVTTGKRPH